MKLLILEGGDFTTYAIIIYTAAHETPLGSGNLTMVGENQVDSTRNVQYRCAKYGCSLVDRSIGTT